MEKNRRDSKSLDDAHPQPCIKGSAHVGRVAALICLHGGQNEKQKFLVHACSQFGPGIIVPTP